MTCTPGKLPNLYGKFSTINGVLIVRMYFERVQLMSLWFMTVQLGNLPY